MKKLLGVFLSTMILVGLYSGVSWGASGQLADILTNIKGAVTQTGANRALNTTLYGAQIKMNWTHAGGDNSNSLSPGDTITSPVTLTNPRTGRTISTATSLVPITSKALLEDWAKKNATDILKIIFPGGLSSAVGVSDDGIMSQESFADNVFQKVKSAQKQKFQQDKINSEFKGALEYLFLDVNDKKGQAVSAVLGYGSSSASGFEYGFRAPYRYSKIDDNISSASHYVGFDFYGKYPAKKWDNGSWNIGADLVGSIIYLTSDAIEHAGNLKYGGGLFTSVVQDFGFGVLSAGLDYKLTKAYFPSSLNPNKDDFIGTAIDYVNDLDAVHTLSYGFNFGVPMLDNKVAINLEVIRSSFISKDIPSDQKNQTMTGLSFSYYPTETFELNLGVRKVFELEGLEQTGIMIGTLYRF